jgi:hypothetical protein
MEVLDKRKFTPEGDRKPASHTIEALQKWVLIRKVSREEHKTEAGVVVVAGGRSSRGVVIHAAKGVPLSPGDVVIFTNFPIELEDLEELTGEKDLKLVRYEEIYARVRKCT